jgi:hypothetical protein
MTQDIVDRREGDAPKSPVRPEKGIGLAEDELMGGAETVYGAPSPRLGRRREKPGQKQKTEPFPGAAF